MDGRFCEHSTWTPSTILLRWEPAHPPERGNLDDERAARQRRGEGLVRRPKEGGPGAAGMMYIRRPHARRHSRRIPHPEPADAQHLDALDHPVAMGTGAPG